MFWITQFSLCYQQKSIRFPGLWPRSCNKEAPGLTWAPQSPPRCIADLEVRWIVLLELAEVVNDHWGWSPVQGEKTVGQVPQNHPQCWIWFQNSLICRNSELQIWTGTVWDLRPYQNRADRILIYTEGEKSGGKHDFNVVNMTTLHHVSDLFRSIYLSKAWRASCFSLVCSVWSNVSFDCCKHRTRKTGSKQ